MYRFKVWLKVYWLKRWQANREVWKEPRCTCRWSNGKRSVIGCALQGWSPGSDPQWNWDEVQGGDRKHREQVPSPDCISAADLVFGLLSFQSNFGGFRLCPYISMLLKPLWQFFIDLAPLRMQVMCPFKMVRTTLSMLWHYISGHQNLLLHFYGNFKIACSGNFLLICTHFCLTLMDICLCTQLYCSLPCEFYYLHSC